MTLLRTPLLAVSSSMLMIPNFSMLTLSITLKIWSLKQKKHYVTWSNIFFSVTWCSTQRKHTVCLLVTIIGNKQLLSRIPHDIFINCDGDQIFPNTHVKNLGLYIDRYMLFDVHISALSKKVMGLLMFFSWISDNFDKSTRIIVVQTLVLSLMDYCTRIWNSTKVTLLHRIQKLQITSLFY